MVYKMKWAPGGAVVSRMGGLRAQRGAALVEYGILVGFLSAASIGALYAVGTGTSESMTVANSKIEDGMRDAVSSTPGAPTGGTPGGAGTFSWDIHGSTLTPVYPFPTPEANEGVRMQFVALLAGTYDGAQALMVLNPAGVEVSATTDAAGAYGSASPPLVQEVCVYNMHTPDQEGEDGYEVGPCGDSSLLIDPSAWDAAVVTTSWEPAYENRHLRGTMTLRMEPMGGSGDNQQVQLNVVPEIE